MVEIRSGTAKLLVAEVKQRSIRLPDTQTAQPAAIIILARYASKPTYMWELQGMETNTKTHTEDIIYDSRDETGMQFSEEHH